MSFILKVIEYRDCGGLVQPDSLSERGGTDLNQVNAFMHLIPEGFCYNYDYVAFLATLHGWSVSCTTKKNKTD